jgi:hypothetical protein
LSAAALGPFGYGSEKLAQSSGFAWRAAAARPEVLEFKVQKRLFAAM